MNKGIYVLIVLAFEAVIFAVHYYVMGELLNKTTDFEPLIMQGLSVIWGISASLVPIISYYLLFLFSKIRNSVLKQTKAEMGLSTNLAEELENRGLQFNKLPILLIAVLSVLFIAEVVFFYKLLYTPSSIFATKETIDFASVIYGLVFAVSHHVITGVGMFILFMFTATSAYKKIHGLLTGDTEEWNTLQFRFF